MAQESLRQRVLASEEHSGHYGRASMGALRGKGQAWARSTQPVPTTPSIGTDQHAEDQVLFVKVSTAWKEVRANFRPIVFISTTSDCHVTPPRCPHSTNRGNLDTEELNVARLFDPTSSAACPRRLPAGAGRRGAGPCRLRRFPPRRRCPRSLP